MGLDGRSIPSVLQPRTPPPLPTNLRVHALTHACMHAGGGLHSCAMHSPAPCSIHPCLLLPSTPLPLACGRLVSVDPPPKWCRYGLSPTCPPSIRFGTTKPYRGRRRHGWRTFLPRAVRLERSERRGEGTGGGNDADGLHAETEWRTVDAWDEEPTGTTQHWCRGARMDCHDGDALGRPCRSRRRVRIVDVDA